MIPRRAAFLAVIFVGATMVSLSDDLRPKKDGIYRGTNTCIICHDFREFETSHNRSLQGPEGILTTQVAGSQVGIFDPATPGYAEFVAPYAEYFNPSNVLFTIGGHGWVQRFLTRVVPSGGNASDAAQKTVLADNRTVLMGVQWNQRQGRWEDYHGPKGDNTWTSLDFNVKCIGCHATGIQPSDKTRVARWVEPGIGCEACHGPSNEINPVELDASQANAICGSCHTRGLSRSDHYEFAWNPQLGGSYQPKLRLADFIDQVAVGGPDFWPDGESRSHHQQYPDLQASRHGQAGVRCTDCHHPHKDEFRGQLRDTTLGVCLTCHGDTLLNSIDRFQHSGHTDRQASCVDCHMPGTAVAIDAGDIRSHTFVMIEPQRAQDFGSPSPCVTCHRDGPGSPKSPQLLEESFLKLTRRYRQGELLTLAVQADRWTGFALANLGRYTVRILATLFDPDGNLLKLPGTQNPRLWSVEPGKQGAFVADEFFGADLSGRRGWIRVSHYEPEVKGFSLTGDGAGSELTGSVIDTSLWQKAVVPLLWPGSRNRIALTNLSTAPAAVSLEPRNAEGASAGQATSIVIDPRARVEFEVESHYAGLSPGGYIALKSDRGLQGKVTASRQTHSAQTPTFPNGKGVLELYLPYFIVGRGWDTLLAVYNSTDRDSEIRLELYTDAAGSVPAHTVVRRVKPYGMWNEAISGLLPTGAGSWEGYARLHAGTEGSGIQAAVGFSSDTGGGMTALPLQPDGSLSVLFSHVAHGKGYWTGLALLAPAGGKATLELVSPEGTIVAAQSIVLDRRRTALLDQLLPVSAVDGGYLRLRSESKLYAFELFGNERNTTLAAVPPQ